MILMANKKKNCMKSNIILKLYNTLSVHIIFAYILSVTENLLCYNDSVLYEKVSAQQ